MDLMNLQVANALTKAGCSSENMHKILKGHMLFCQSGQFV